MLLSSQRRLSKWVPLSSRVIPMLKSIFQIIRPHARAKFFLTQHYLKKYHPHVSPICKLVLISVFALLCNTLHRVSLCVDVLRGNHTTTERAVITQTRLHQNWKLYLELKRVLNRTLCGVTPHGRRWAQYFGSIWFCIFRRLWSFTLSGKRRH